MHEKNIKSIFSNTIYIILNTLIDINHQYSLTIGDVDWTSRHQWKKPPPVSIRSAVPLFFFKTLHTASKIIRHQRAYHYNKSSWWCAYTYTRVYPKETRPMERSKYFSLHVASNELGVLYSCAMLSVLLFFFLLRAFRVYSPLEPLKSRNDNNAREVVVCGEIVLWS